MTFRPRIIPCLLLSGNGLVKTKRFAEPVYVGDPINAVRVFNDLEADELLLLDIEAGINGIRFDLVHRIAEEAWMPLTYGGGITTTEDVSKLIGAGVEKVVLHRSLEKDLSLVQQVSERFGSQAVVAAMDVRKTGNEYRAYMDRGKRPIDTDCLTLAKNFESAGAGELLVQFIDRDGTGQGFDLAFVAYVSKEIGIPLIACGGAGSLNDLKAVTKSGASAASAGSLFCFLGGRDAVMINYPDREELNRLFSNDQ